MNPKDALFVIVASWTGLSAIAVVVSQNIVRSAAWLLFSLAGTAGIYFLLGADFVGATQLIVYVGGVLVLVIFGVMLTAQGPFISLKTSTGDWGIAGLVGLIFLGVLSSSILFASWPVASDARMKDAAYSKSSVALGQAFLGIKEVSGPGNVTSFPSNAPRTRLPMGYLLPFELVSVHLLVVLIGAAYLARAKRRLRKPR